MAELDQSGMLRPWLMSCACFCGCSQKEAQTTAVIPDGRTMQPTPESGARAGDDGYKRKKHAIMRSHNNVTDRLPYPFYSLGPKWHCQYREVKACYVRQANKGARSGFLNSPHSITSTHSQLMQP